jgi:endonuclease III
MLYVIPETLLKVSLSTNKTDHHVKRYSWVLNDTFNTVSDITYDMLASFIGINATVNNISAMMYNMAFSFIE